MKKIYLDCGTHLGEGLNNFIEMFSITDKWEVYSFEPNTELWQLHDSQNTLSNVKYINKAIYVHDDTIKFNIAHPNTDASSIFGKHIGDNLSKTVDMQCLDLSKFILDNFSKDDFIVVKMDIEGAEYEVLRKMIKDNSIFYINHLFVEFHSHKDNCAILENGEDKKTTNELFNQIKNLGININFWH
jgi:hypothetical protein